MCLSCYNCHLHEVRGSAPAILVHNKGKMQQKLKLHTTQRQQKLKAKKLDKLLNSRLLVLCKPVLQKQRLNNRCSFLTCSHSSVSDNASQLGCYDTCSGGNYLQIHMVLHSGKLTSSATPPPYLLSITYNKHSKCSNGSI